MKKIVAIAVLALLLTSTASYVHAQGGTANTGGGGTVNQGGGGTVNQGGGGTGNQGTVRNPLGDLSLQSLFARVLEFLVALAVPFIVLMIMYSGFLFVTARGNEQKIKDARSMFQWTIIGGLLILGASVIANVIKGTVDDISTITQFFV